MGLIGLLFVLGLIFFSTDWAAEPDQRMAKVRMLLFMCTGIFVGLTLFVVTVVDMLESFVVYRRERREAFQQMIREEVAAIAEREKQRKNVLSGEGA